MPDERKVHQCDHRSPHPPDLFEVLLSGQARYDAAWKARSQEDAGPGEYPVEVRVPAPGGQGVVTVRCALEVEETAANSRVLGQLLAGDVTAAAVEAAMASVTYRLVPAPQARVD